MIIDGTREARIMYWLWPSSSFCQIEDREHCWCGSLIWPTWAPFWVRCGSVVRSGRCAVYGHQDLL